MNDELKEFADIVHLLIELECVSCKSVFAEPKGDTEEAFWEWSKEVSTAAHKEGWRSTAKGFLCKNCLMATQNE